MGSGVFWALIGGFFVGVFARSLFPVGCSFAAFCLLVSAGALALGYIGAAPRASALIAAIAFAACAGGIARTNAAAIAGDPALSAHLGANVVVAGIVSQEPDARETSTLITVDASELIVGSTTVPVRSRVLAALSPHALLRYGDEVRVTGVLQLPEAFATSADREFDYPSYLATQGIAYELAYAQAGVEGATGDPVKAAVYSLKEAYLRGTQASLTEPQAALAGGITVGDKRSIGPDLSLALRRDSLVHMIVLSGYNITVVLNALARLLQWAPRSVQFGGSIGVAVFFILLSGGASSATRSGLMALAATLARATHRVYIGERIIAAVSFVMVAWNPLIFCFDPGFQLSVLATLGLTLFTPHFSAWFSRIPPKFGIREILASTCATQLMVLPLLLYQNGTLSLVALPANALALAPVPFAMFFSFVAALGGMFLGPLAPALALPAYALLSYIIAVVRIFAALPFAAIMLPSFGAWWLAGAYALLSGSLLVLRGKKGTPAS